MQVISALCPPAAEPGRLLLPCAASVLHQRWLGGHSAVQAWSVWRQRLCGGLFTAFTDKLPLPLQSPEVPGRQQKGLSYTQQAFLLHKLSFFFLIVHIAKCLCSIFLRVTFCPKKLILSSPITSSPSS
ncbi:hypothetical protein HJG60_010504 [Phyllostomus discolor]|uniref:Uncharacterized protein n=1 Tax=Phyllostomus discolor TaxID=89673 RepID=A0A834ANW4_9CHIR|nr:hypothetical protein HJG60_010504 [Phyllostomus discolor]